MIRPSRSFDRKPFATFRLAKSERRTELSVTIASWVIIAAIVIAVLSLLSGCGSTDGAPVEAIAPNYAVPTEGPDGIRMLLSASNLNEPHWRNAGELKRWNIERDGLVPVKLNGSATGAAALDLIEQTLGMPVFDRVTIADLPDSEITRGLIAREGEAVMSCGNVNNAPGEPGWLPNIDPDGSIRARVYVNFGDTDCTATIDIASHEFGHALGLGGHFAGFGIGSPVSPNFWNALYNLYHNAIGTSEANLTIIQAVQ